MFLGTYDQKKFQTTAVLKMEAFPLTNVPPGALVDGPSTW